MRAEMAAGAAGATAVISHSVLAEVERLCTELLRELPSTAERDEQILQQKPPTSTTAASSSSNHSSPSYDHDEARRWWWRRMAAIYRVGQRKVIDDAIDLVRRMATQAEGSGSTSSSGSAAAHGEGDAGGALAALL